MNDGAEVTSKKKAKPAWIRSMLAFFLKVLVTVLIIWIVLTWIVGIYVCHDNSSYPMIKDGDLCMTYRLSELNQGDVIVYKNNGETRFGRIIALAGNEVSFQNDKVIINGYEYFDSTVYPTSAEGTEIQFPHTVSENCVFVLNDYRSDISDSRAFGDIPLDGVQGKIVFVMRRRGI